MLTDARSGKNSANALPQMVQLDFMDDLILQTATVLGWLCFVAIGLSLIALCLAIAWRIMRNVWGLKLLMASMKFHKQHHPEAWKRFNGES